MKVEKLLRDLVEIPSPSGEERELGEFIASLLEERYNVVRQKIGDRFNVLAYVGKPRVLMNAHLDTVPGRLEVREDSEFIYGRGACDTKGSIASMIAAGDVLLEKGVTDFGFLFDVSEETDFSGIKEAVKIIPESVRTIIVGEPTSVDVVSGQKGILAFKLICRGKAAHGSNPEKGINAIEMLCEQIEILRELKLPKDSVLGKNIMNIAKISGGTADNIVPDYAEVDICIRCSTNPEIILELLKKNLNKVEIEVKLNYSPIISKIAGKIAELINSKERVVSYFTEAYFLAEKADAFVLGPGDVSYAHSDNEMVNKEELNQAVKKYFEIITYLNQKNLRLDIKRRCEDGNCKGIQ